MNIFLRMLKASGLAPKDVGIAANLVEVRVQFGDRVRILSDPVTEARGLVGRTGTAYGVTTPSVTGIEVIGTPSSDVAVKVSIEDIQEQFWFAENLLEFVDHNAGTTTTLDGVNLKWTRNADGGWTETELDAT
jgi:hypothetical protein